MSKRAPSDPAMVVGLSASAVTRVDFMSEPDPFRIFAAWYHDAQREEPSDPNAMALATVDDAGLPNARMVLLKGVDTSVAGPKRGFLFYTNMGSAKGQELSTQKKAALVFHWKSLQRQVRVRGSVVRVKEDEADQYFATRPRGSQIGAWASPQSRPLAGRATLAAAVAKVTAENAIGTIPRPPYWSGFRLMPVEMEFWQAGTYRLHDRRQFKREDAGSAWQVQQLWP